MTFRCTKPIAHPVETLASRPWELSVKPLQVAPQTWYVAGQTWVGCYLIDTGDGLILLDTAIPESLYLLVDSIYSLGYRPEDIKKILISHAHFDHCGGAAAMCGYAVDDFKSVDRKLAVSGSGTWCISADLC